MTTNQLSRAQYVRKADAACAKAYNRTREGFEAFVKGKADPFSSDAEMREYATTVMVPARKALVRELRSLGAPAGDEEEVEAIIEAFEEGIDATEEDPSAVISSSVGPYPEATALAESYGLTNCR